MLSAIRCGALGTASVIVFGISAAPAAAQVSPSLQVVTKATSAKLWLRAPSHVVGELQPGTKLDVLDREGDWLWVIVPPDANGTRRSGWVRSDSVEPIVIRPVPITSADNRSDALPSPAETTAGEDKVTITVADKRAEEPAAVAAPAAAAPSFDDVHFERNRSSLRPDDTGILRAAVAALKADPSLVVNIEGHTCSLGTAAYNRALGLRRANEVKDYFVREGIEESRLRTVSKGEADPQYDNSREETRRLNRRVAVVPERR